MGETTDTGIKGLEYALAIKATPWETISNICFDVKKHKDTIRKFKIIKRIHVESLKE